MSYFKRIILFAALTVSVGLLGYYLGYKSGLTSIEQNTSNAQIAEESYKQSALSSELSNESKDLKDIFTGEATENANAPVELSEEQIPQKQDVELQRLLGMWVPKSEFDAHMDFQLAALNNRLSLSESQQEALYEIMLAKGSLSDFYPHALALLDPDQQEELDLFLEDQQMSNWEIRANIELARLQSTLNLSETMKDSIFTVFVELQRDYSIDFEEQRDSFEANRLRLEKLSPYLDEAQKELYLAYLQTSVHLWRILSHGV